MVHHSGNTGIEYEFVVYPGGKVSDIQMEWNGLESIKRLKNSGIKYSCSLGEMTESAPYTYQGTVNQIESHFVLKNNIIAFKTAAYDKTKPLVIDPTLVWRTYFGGSGPGAGVTGVKTDIKGNIYFSGLTQSHVGISTSGAYQTLLNGIQNAFLAKFNSNGKIIWATYFGGNNFDQASSVSTDTLGNVFITGLTESKTNIATAGSYQTFLAGIRNSFLAKFNSAGSLLWSTYYGGNGIDEGTNISNDLNGNAYISGETSSISGMATSGAYQASLGANVSGFLAKFSPSGKLLWATYYGGDFDCNGLHTSIDYSGNIFISGTTYASKNLATSGTHQTSYGGGSWDAFLSKFNSSGKLLWASYYGGSGSDGTTSICSDTSGNIYITGLTTSSNGIASSGAYQTFYTGVTDAFLAKFDNSGGLLWSTYYGGNCTNESYGVIADHFGNVFLTGGPAVLAAFLLPAATKVFIKGGLVMFFWQNLVVLEGEFGPLIMAETEMMEPME